MKRLSIIRIVKYSSVSILIFVIIFTLSVRLDRTKTKVYGFSNLISTEEVQELTLMEFKWAGIANINKKYLNYEATVKSSISINDIDEIYTVNREKKQIIIKPKKIEIEVLDADVISTIPDKVNIELREQTLACMTDAEAEIMKSGEFIRIAKENEIHVLKSLIEPFANDWNFSIKLEDGDLSE